MINRRLTSAETATRLGIKPATLYAYVSRGLLHPERSPRGSTFDPREVARLARSARNPGVGAGGASGPTEAAPSEPVFVTELTLIDRGRLYYRGVDAVELSRTRTFQEVSEWLWTGRWAGGGGNGGWRDGGWRDGGWRDGGGGDGDGRDGGWRDGGGGDGDGEGPSGSPEWSVPPAAVDALRRAMSTLPAGGSVVERFMLAVVTAALSDELRHDLTPSGVAVTARRILAVLITALPHAERQGPPGSVRRRTPRSGGPARSGGESVGTQVWRGLTGRAPSTGEEATVEAALVLAADHELAPSTLASRVAASFRADPYAVVLTGLGPASGSWYAGSTGAPTEVESLLTDAATMGPERAVGERLRREGGPPHGFGMPLYPDGDPRGAELLSRLDAVGSPERRQVVHGLLEVGAERGFPPPNFDLGLGALAFCAGMEPGAGQAIFTLGKVAGWLAHAIEEYTMPTRFRTRADYVGPLPGAPGAGAPSAGDSMRGTPAEGSPVAGDPAAVRGDRVVVAGEAAVVAGEAAVVAGDPVAVAVPPDAGSAP